MHLVKSITEISATVY